MLKSNEISNKLYVIRSRDSECSLALKKVVTAKFYRIWIYIRMLDLSVFQ